MKRPMQFNFAKQWQTTIKAVRNHHEGMRQTESRWLEIAELKRDDLLEHDPVRAAAEYDLDYATLEVKKWSLHWLREWNRGGGSALTDLAFGIATAVYPEKRWEIVDDDEYAVVTDRERTIVFDFENFDRITAGASLHIAGDQKYSPSRDDLESAAGYLGERSAEAQRILALIKSHLAEARRPELEIVS